jgi:hypothetical protein
VDFCRRPSLAFIPLRHFLPHHTLQVWKLLAGQRALPSDLIQHDMDAATFLERVRDCAQGGAVVDEDSFTAAVCPGVQLFFTTSASDGRCVSEPPNVPLRVLTVFVARSLVRARVRVQHRGARAWRRGQTRDVRELHRVRGGSNGHATARVRLCMRGDAPWHGTEHVCAHGSAWSAVPDDRRCRVTAAVQTSLVPERALRLFTWRELELMVCPAPLSHAGCGWCRGNLTLVHPW